MVRALRPGVRLDGAQRVGQRALPRNFRQTACVIATLATALTLAGAFAAVAERDARSATSGTWNFVSAPGLHPPKLNRDAPTATGRLAPGYFLVANFYNQAAHTQMVGQGGPMLLDSHLQPVWFRPVLGRGMAVADFKEQRYEGHPVLTWWQGAINAQGITLRGEDIIVDQHYRTIATLAGSQDGWVIDMHEFVISGHNGWVTAYRTLPRQNLRRYGGPADGTIYDSAVQEYDLRTGKLLYRWDALKHIPLTASEQRPPSHRAWDPYHVNSIEPLPGRRFLVSMRNDWAGYLVRARTGAVEWTLGGKFSNFRFGPSAQFEWQHDIELHPRGLITVFDDHCCDQLPGAGLAAPTGVSRGLILRLNPARHVATQVMSIARRPDAAFMGNIQVLPGGNLLVGWGSTPYFTEYSPQGKLLLDAVWPNPAENTNLSYRAYASTWVGMPLFPPKMAVRRINGKTTVYASWNGATRVATWAVLAGPGARRLSRVATTPRSGFETAIPLTQTAIPLTQTFRVFRVEALDAAGRVLGASRTFTAG